MRPEDLVFWLRAAPFVPFRIVMNSGTTFEVRHPEMLVIMRTSFVYFVPTDEPLVYDRGHMFGLVLIERIDPVAAPPAAGSNGAARA